MSWQADKVGIRKMHRGHSSWNIAVNYFKKRYENPHMTPHLYSLLCSIGRYWNKSAKFLFIEVRAN